MSAHRLSRNPARVSTQPNHLTLREAEWIVMLNVLGQYRGFAFHEAVARLNGEAEMVAALTQTMVDEFQRFGVREEEIAKEAADIQRRVRTLGGYFLPQKQYEEFVETVKEYVHGICRHETVIRPSITKILEAWFALGARKFSKKAAMFKGNAQHMGGVPPMYRHRQPVYMPARA